jgi:hypothetical protein
VRLGSLKGSSARASAKTGPQSIGKGPGQLRQDLPLLAPVTQKRLERVDRALVSYGLSFRPVFARPPTLMVWWGLLQPAAAGSSRLAARSRDRCAVCARRQAPPRSLGPSLIAGSRRERLVSAVTAVTRRQRRDSAVTAVTGVIAVSAVIAGFVLLGPSGPLRTVAKGAVPRCLP